MLRKMKSKFDKIFSEQFLEIQSIYYTVENFTNFLEKNDFADFKSWWYCPVP